MDSKSKKIENYLKEKILPELEKGRPGFDLPHTLAVVFWLKQIFGHAPTNVDKIVLLIAAYAHDWGYAELFSVGNLLQYEEVQDAKAEHMQKGAAKLVKLLNNKVFSSLTEDQKKRCVYLVAVHDRLDQLRDEDELILLEADTLGGLDVNYVRPTFDIESNNRYLREVRKRRVPKFITDFSKGEVDRLIRARMDYYKDQQRVNGYD